MDNDGGTVKVPSELEHGLFNITAANGFDRSLPVARQDPSNILKIDGRYHVWYTRFNNLESWEEIWPVSNFTEIWLAVSEDGRNWTEQGNVMRKSRPGSWHETGKHAPHVFVEGGKYFMIFTAGHRDGHWARKWLGLAVADSPQGPFVPLDDRSPLLSSEDGIYDVTGQDDGCVIAGNGPWRLYFKGYGFDEKQQKVINNNICLAFSDRPEGPYRRYDANPVTTSHTACVWPQKEGVAMISDCYPPSIKYSEDGFTFVRTADIVAETDDDTLKEGLELCVKHWHTGIADPGVYLPEEAESEDNDGVKGVRWGLSQFPDKNLETGSKGPHHTPFLVRFEWRNGKTGEFC